VVEERLDSASRDAAIGPGVASLLRAIANDLKRNDEAADADLGLAPGTFADLVAGRRAVTWELIQRVSAVWPVSERDLLPVRDDCPLGVRVHRFESSLKSARIIERGGAPYYEYRDTAMSRLASYRPEWIRMLRTVDNDDPGNPAVAWNSGHLLYQFTFFVGPVNYYYEWGGTKRCVRMRTGDSIFGLPFAPHTFTARDDTEPAYILALTYGGHLTGDPQRELSALGPAAGDHLALSLSPEAGQAELLKGLLRGRMFTLPELSARCHLSVVELEAILAGHRQPSGQELAVLAEALDVAVRDLLLPAAGTVDGVAVQLAATARSWWYPAEDDRAFRVTQLARTAIHPHTTALTVDVLANDEPDHNSFQTYQHQYVYVLDGVGSARMSWEHAGRRHHETISGGDSAYVKPGVPVRFSRTGPGILRLLVLRIGGSVTTEVRSALGAMPAGGVERYLAESQLWYDPKGGAR